MNIKKPIWHRLWARKYAPYMGYAFLRVFTKRPHWNLLQNKAFIPEGGLYAMYFEKHEMDTLARQYGDFLVKQDLNKYSRIYEGYFRKFLDWSKKASKNNFAKLTIKQLIDFLDVLSEKMIFFAEPQFMAFLMQEYLGNLVEQKISQQKNASEILGAVSFPFKTTRLIKAKLELLRIAEKRGQGLENYAKKNAWLPVYEFIDEPWALKDFQNQLKNIKDPKKEITDYHNHVRKAKKVYLAYLKSIKDKKFKKQVETVHYFGYLKEMRDDYRREAYWHLQKFWREVAKRLNVRLEETNYLLPNELSVFLRTGNKKYLHLIEKRKSKYALLLRGGRSAIYSRQAAEKIRQQVVGKQESKELLGRASFPGKVRGHAKIIFHQGEFAKFKRSDILITTMTHPEFLPIMRLAKAIVTDEGGITCHAAITSRELKTPCVIGTKMATKVLRDGDFIEVDANKGEVKLLKQAKHA